MCVCATIPYTTTKGFLVGLLVRYKSFFTHDQYNVQYYHDRCVARLRLEEESYSCSQEVYDDGIILPHQTRQVSAHQ